MIATAAAMGAADDQGDVVVARVFENLLGRISPHGYYRDATTCNFLLRQQCFQAFLCIRPQTLHGVEERATRRIASPGLVQWFIHDIQDMKRRVESGGE